MHKTNACMELVVTDDNKGWNTEPTPQGERRTTKSGRKFGKVLYAAGFVAEPASERDTQPMQALDSNESALGRQTNPRHTQQ